MLGASSKHAVSIAQALLADGVLEPQSSLHSPSKPEMNHLLPPASYRPARGLFVERQIGENTTPKTETQNAEVLSVTATISTPVTTS